MRTFLSQLATARYSPAVEKDRSEMLSSGGDVSSTSLVRSPAWFAADCAALDAVLLPKRVVMCTASGSRGGRDWGRQAGGSPAERGATRARVTTGARATAGTGTAPAVTRGR